MERVPPSSLLLLLLLLLLPSAVVATSEHECLAAYAASQSWRSVTVAVQAPAALNKGALLSLVTVFSRRGVFTRLSPEPAPGGWECPFTSSEATDGTVLLAAAGGALLCPSGSLHAWTEMRRSGRGGVLFTAVSWDGDKRRMAAVDSVHCFGGRLTGEPVRPVTSDFRGVLQGVHVAVSVVGKKSGAPMDGKGSGITNIRGQSFSQEGEGILLTYMSELLGFSYSVRLVSQDADGKSFNHQEILLANNTVDMTVNSLTQTVRRSSMMKFSFPISTYQDRVAIKKSRLTRRPFEPKRPFSESAWVGVVLFMSLISLWMAACQALAIFSAVDNRRGACRQETTFVSSWWALMAMLCRQYGAGLPAPSRPSRAVLGFLCFGFTFLVTSFYSSVIHSFMAMESRQLPYASVRHGLESGRLRVGFTRGGVMERKMLSARDPLQRLIADGERARPSGVDFWSQDSDQLGAWLQAGPHQGFLLSERDLDTYQALHPAGAGCRVCLLPEMIAARPSGLAYSRRFEHSRLLDVQLVRLRELGLLQRAVGHRHGPGEQQFCQLDATAAGWRPLGLEDLSTVFAVLWTGAAAAMLLLAAERTVFLVARLAAEEPAPMAAHIP